MAEMECSECGADLFDKQKFCSGCGIEIEWPTTSAPALTELPEMECSECGADLFDKQKFCSGCGIEIEWPENPLPTFTESQEIKSESSLVSQETTTNSKWKVAAKVAGVLLLIYLFAGGSGLSIFGNGALNRPAVDYIITGEASQTLQQVWGVDLNTSTGPVTLQDMADQAFAYTSRSVGGGLTKSEVEIAFQPGNSMHSFFNRLLNSQDAIDAVRKRWISLAN
jgi:ribosomal protein L37E